MATYKSGATSQIMIGAEASVNTMEATPIGIVLRVSSFTFDGIRELIENDDLVSDNNPKPDEKGLQKVTAQLVANVSADEAGALLYFFLEEYAVSGSGPYAHTYKVSTTNPLTCFVQVGDTEATKYDLFNGLAVSGISFGTISKGQSAKLKMTVDFAATGKYTLNGGSSADASPETYDDRQHVQNAVSVEIDTTATALIREVSFGMTRTITPNDVLDGNLYSSDFDWGDYQYPSFTMKGWKDSGETIVGYDDDAEHVVEIISPRPAAATRSVEVKCSECLIYNSEGEGQVSSRGPRMATVKVRPSYVDHADASSVVFTVNSDVADYGAVIAP